MPKGLTNLIKDPGVIQLGSFLHFHNEVMPFEY